MRRHIHTSTHWRRCCGVHSLRTRTFTYTHCWSVPSSSLTLLLHRLLFHPPPAVLLLPPVCSCRCSYFLCNGFCTHSHIHSVSSPLRLFILCAVSLSTSFSLLVHLPSLPSLPLNSICLFTAFYPSVPLSFLLCETASMSPTASTVVVLAPACSLVCLFACLLACVAVHV